MSDKQISSVDFQSYILGLIPNISGFIPDVSGYVPDVSGYIPNVSGYVPDVSGYVPDVSGYIPNVSEMTLDGYFSEAAGAWLPYSEWYPRTSGKAALKTIKNLTLQQIRDGEWRNEWHIINAYHICLIDVEIHGEEWKTEVQALDNALKEILLMVIPEDMKECLGDLQERVEKSLDETS